MYHQLAEVTPTDVTSLLSYRPRMRMVSINELMGYVGYEWKMVLCWNFLQPFGGNMQCCCWPGFNFQLPSCFLPNMQKIPDLMTKIMIIIFISTDIKYFLSCMLSYASLWGKQLTWLYRPVVEARPQPHQEPKIWLHSLTSLIQTIINTNNNKGILSW